MSQVGKAGMVTTDQIDLLTKFTPALNKSKLL